MATVYIATPPPRRAHAPAKGRPFNLMQIQEGVTWYRQGEDWFQANYLDDDFEADEIYRGGYDHEVTSEKATELEALGFTIRTEER